VQDLLQVVLGQRKRLAQELIKIRIILHVSNTRTDACTNVYDRILPGRAHLGRTKEANTKKHNQARKTTCTASAASRNIACMGVYFIGTSDGAMKKRQTEPAVCQTARRTSVLIAYLYVNNGGQVAAPLWWHVVPPLVDPSVAVRPGPRLIARLRSSLSS
jgi:hypothetical protein